MVLDGISSQECPVNAGVPGGSILGPAFPNIHLWTLWCYDHLWLFYCNIAVHADDTTLYSKCDQTSDWWQ